MRRLFAILTILTLAGCSPTPTDSGGASGQNVDADGGAPADVQGDTDSGGMTPIDTATGADGRSDTRSGGRDSRDMSRDSGGLGERDGAGGEVDTGPECTCEGESTCCDGCQPRNEGEGCDNGENNSPAQCEAGECVDRTWDSCECGRESAPCCDGCLHTPDEVCDRNTRKRCSNPDSACSSTLLIQEQVRRCIDPDGAQTHCEDDWSDWKTVERTKCGRPKCCDITDDRTTRKCL